MAGVEAFINRNTPRLDLPLNQSAGLVADGSDRNDEGHVGPCRLECGGDGGRRTLREIGRACAVPHDAEVDVGQTGDDPRGMKLAQPVEGEDRVHVGFRLFKCHTWFQAGDSI